jgi:hypothetical protein
LCILIREINAVYSENHTGPINTFREKSAEFLNVEEDGTDSYHCAFKG